MGDPLSFVEALLARLRGPLNFRFVLQPLVAFFFAFRDGRKDVREGRKPFLWALFTDRGHRREMLLSGCKSIGTLFVVATVLDLVFQDIELHAFRLHGALVAGVILAIIPYVLLRGPVNRLTRRKVKAATRAQDQ
jgi:hypothetical protein